MPGVRIALSAEEASAALARFRGDLKATGTQAMMTEKQVKDLERQMLANAAAQRQTKGFQDLTRMMGLTKRESIALAKEMKLDPNEVVPKEIEGRVGSLGMKLMGVAMAAGMAYAAIKKMVSPFLDYLGRMETYSLGIATSFMMNGKYIDETTGKILEGRDALMAARKEAVAMMEELKIANLESTATLDQLVRAYQLTLPVAMSRGFDPKMAKNFTMAMVQAAGTIDPILLEQLGEETRSMLMGTINPRTSRIATIAGLRTADNAKIQKMEAKELYDYLMDRLKAYTFAGIESMNTWAGLWSNFKDIVMQVGGQAFEPLFIAIKQWLGDLTGDIIKITTEVDKLGNVTKKIEFSGDVQKFVKDFKEGLVDIINLIRTVSIFLDQLGGTMTQIGYAAMKFSEYANIGMSYAFFGGGGPPMQGAIAARENAKQLDEWNKMFNKRAAATDKASADFNMMMQGYRALTQKELETISPYELQRGYLQKQGVDKKGRPTEQIINLGKMQGLQGETYYYIQKETGGKAAYKQNPQQKEVDEKLQEKIDSIEQRLREDIEKETKDAQGILEVQYGRYLHELTGKKEPFTGGIQLKGKALLDEWMRIKEEALKDERLRKTAETMWKVAEERIKAENEVVIAKQEAANKILKLDEDLAAKESEIMVERGWITEREMIDKRTAAQKRSIDAEMDLIQTKLNLIGYSGDFTEAVSKETQLLWLQYKALIADKDALENMTDAEKELYDIRKRKEMQETLGFYSPDYKGIKQKEIDTTKKQMEDQHLDEIAIEKWVTNEKKKLDIEELQFKIATADNWLEAMGQRWDLYKLQAEDSVSHWVKAMEEGVEGLKSTLSDFFFDFLTGEMKTFEDYWRSFCRSLARALSDALAQSVINSVLFGGGRQNAGVGDLIGKGVKAIGSWFGLGGSANTAGMPTEAEAAAMSRASGEAYGGYYVAKGDAFYHGNVIPFAKGTIIDQPTVFPMANGTGLMGEAGPEAVMPLTRDASGSLGVKALIADTTAMKAPAGDDIISASPVTAKDSLVNLSNATDDVSEQSKKLTMDFTNLSEATQKEIELKKQSQMQYPEMQYTFENKPAGWETWAGIALMLGTGIAAAATKGSTATAEASGGITDELRQMANDESVAWGYEKPYKLGGLVRFAKGTIIDQPTIFPMANGTGLMGEAGEEAIMPLARNAKGELGVKGGSSTETSYTISVPIVINAPIPNAAQFQSGLRETVEKYCGQFIEENM